MELAVEKYKVENEPYYLPIRQEVELFEAAYAAKLPAMSYTGMMADSLMAVVKGLPSLC